MTLSRLGETSANTKGTPLSLRKTAGSICQEPFLLPLLLKAGSRVVQTGLQLAVKVKDGLNLLVLLPLFLET